MEEDYIPEEIDYAAYAQKVKQKEGYNCLNKLSDYLARRDHSISELKQKLRKHFDQEAIDWALQQAEENNWLSNEKELSERAAESLHCKNKGYLYIKNFMRKKGLPEPQYDQDRELEKAQEILESKFDLQNLSYEDKQKAFRMLKNRGFEDSVIRSIIF